MYCEKCNKQSPDNFKHCAYCGASFHKKRKNSDKENKLFQKLKSYRMPTMKNRVLSLIVIAIVLAIASIITGVATGSKPDRLVKVFAAAVEADDEEMFYTLYDEYIKS